MFGAVVAGAIGPIALLVFGMAARQGFAAGAFAGLGAALADFLYALAAFSIGALVMPLVAAHEKSIAVGCALLLIGLGAAMLLRLARGNGGSGHGEARRRGPGADLPAHDREPDDARRVRGHRAAAARGGFIREGGGACARPRCREHRLSSLRSQDPAPRSGGRCPAKTAGARSLPRLRQGSWHSGSTGSRALSRLRRSPSSRRPASPRRCRGACAPAGRSAGRSPAGSRPACCSPRARRSSRRRAG